MYFRTWIASAVATGTLVAGGVVLTSQGSEAVTPTPSASTSSATSSATSGTAVDGAESTDDEAGDVEATEPSTSELESIVTDSRYAVAVLDVDTGETLTYGDDGTFDTASIVKVAILAALLHQHEEAGTELSATESAQATAMIEQSDNASATALFEAVGGKTGLDAFLTSIGLTDTVVGSNGSWGLTQTTPTDQLTLLQVVLGDGGVLSDESQAYARSLMGDVVDTQNLGVSAAADDADEAVLKVGYLQRSATGLWDVTSVGEIEADGHTYFVAVLADGSASFDAGVSLVDAVAVAAVDGM